MTGVQHAHREHVEGCFRCDLSSDEARWAEERTLAEWREASVRAARSFPDEDMDTNVSHRIVYLIDELARVTAERDRWQREAANRARFTEMLARVTRESNRRCARFVAAYDRCRRQYAVLNRLHRAAVQALEATGRAIEEPEGMEGP